MPIQIAEGAVDDARIARVLRFDVPELRRPRARGVRGADGSSACPGIEPWHALEALVAEDGMALVLHPSGSCPVPCVQAGCLTYELFAREHVQVGVGRFRIRARRLSTAAAVLDVEPVAQEGGAQCP